MRYVEQFLIAGVLMGAIDGVWLSFVADRFYKSQVGALLRQKPNMGAAMVFYVLYLIGLVVFVIHPAVNTGSLASTMAYGGLFGLVAYGTYDLTNLATLKSWPLKLVIVDMVWGTFLTSVVAGLAYCLALAWGL